MLQDLFVAQSMPDLEGHLMVKEGKKGQWKRYFFVFRKSGLYFSAKGKMVVRLNGVFPDILFLLIVTKKSCSSRVHAYTVSKCSGV